MQRSDILSWLKETDETRLETLWAQADATRKAHVGDEVHLRGLIEIGNYCVRQCAYCGINACSQGITRYRMRPEEILECARTAHRLGYGSVVMQSGEDPGFKPETIADLVREIKTTTPLAVTLSLGEREDEELRLWKAAGADRYLLRFETSDPVLYDRIHPALPGTLSDRMAQLERMRDMGYEIGTGVMVGIPGQTWDILAQDIDTFRHYDMDMLGIGPFLPSPRTPLGGEAADTFRAAPGDQVPNDELTTLKAVALARLVCPQANIPSTTALATLDPQTGRELGLNRGANVVMPNVTPPEYRVLYEIYPGKACVHETAQVCHGCMEARIRSIGRVMGKGPGGRRAAQA
ncbi:[FeFe] hydrogenase H-cluster radical SAM maturase HydE [Mesoterricola sediminis]|uniref:[FeFe] hydrogenase H-cluster radical SAM maturase HydE n=1 Tax=Mesoterricola sediminis TaxID=2927980 RepID=A0AA48GXF2_9BACT|nr:[FeFe] hydrogenase H-cluster radical SAM maturase HydE [Mesoterricola sediminis]BDU77410.1 [FeFe] hydrogenase H-cluster radical SAM maturase HydE [Mesoterricola sediminis]